MHEKQERERRINVVIDKETHRKLRIEAVELDRPMNALARDVIQGHFSQKEQRNEKA